DFALRGVLTAAAEVADAADVFVERGAFDIEQARRYLTVCAGARLALRLHGGQFTEIGAVGLAIELGATSIDHLEATGDDGVRALAESRVTAVLLPASALFLGRPMPPARKLVDAGAAVALATDFNPGSAFCESLPLVCSLACTQLGLSPQEALGACTVNAAQVLGRDGEIGRLEPGKEARKAQSGRPARKVDPPSWNRVVRRALILAPAIFFALTVLSHKQPVGTRLFITAFYTAFFIPFMYLLDRTMYRTYLRRTGQ